MNYTLKDRQYFEVLRRVCEDLDRQKIAYALVGGAGIQSRIADILCRVNKIDISNVDNLETLLRETRDIDITSRTSEADFVKFFNEMQASNTNILIEPVGVRSRRIILKGKEKAEIYLNYQTGPQDLSGLDESFYNQCIDTAENLKLKYSNLSSDVFVARPEYLIASKITRNDPKDIWDISVLLKVMRQYPSYCKKFNANKVKELLERANKGEMYGRIEEIKKQILKQ